MKKRISSVIGILVAFFALFACVACNGSFRGGAYVYENADKYTAGGGMVAEPVRNLEIDWVSGVAFIHYHTKDTVEFSEECKKELTEDTQMYYSYDSGTLRIKFAKSGSVLFNPTEKRLNVYLPEGTVLDKLETDTVSANVTAEGISAKKIDVDTVSGGIKLESFNDTQEVEADSTSADVILSFSGGVEKADIDTVSGSVHVTAPKIDDFDCDTVSGSVGLYLEEAPSRIDIGTVSGGVVLYLPSVLNATLDFDTVSGSFNSEIECSIKGKYTATFGDGANAYSVETTSGNLQIKER